MKISRKKGFTLIELLTTIAIVGILASISLAMYNSYREVVYDLESELISDGIKKALFSLTGLVDQMPTNDGGNTTQVVGDKSFNGNSVNYTLTGVGDRDAKVRQVLNSAIWPIVAKPYISIFFIYQPSGDITLIDVRNCKGSASSSVSMSGDVTNSRSGYSYYRNGTVETSQKASGASIAYCQAQGF